MMSPCPLDRRAFLRGVGGMNLVLPVLDAMEVPTLSIEENSDIAKILEAVDRAYAESRPLVVLFGRRVKP